MLLNRKDLATSFIWRCMSRPSPTGGADRTEGVSGIYPALHSERFDDRTKLRLAKRCVRGWSGGSRCAFKFVRRNLKIFSAYTALSRATHINGVQIILLERDAFLVDEEAILEFERLQSIWNKHQASVVIRRSRLNSGYNILMRMVLTLAVCAWGFLESVEVAIEFAVARS